MTSWDHHSSLWPKATTVEKSQWGYSQPKDTMASLIHREALSGQRPPQFSMTKWHNIDWVIERLFVAPRLQKSICRIDINFNKMPVNNYRPISILSSINKIFEKILYARLIKYIHKFQLLYKYQFGLRKNYWAEHALKEITD